MQTDHFLKRSSPLGGNFRSLLVTASPVLCFMTLAPRTENETSINAWIGVLGYSRSTTWLGLPVYQNFLNFGSALPLMSNISLSPLSILGTYLPVQHVQICMLALSTLLCANALLKESFLQHHIRYLKTTISCILGYPFLHYLYANDWTEFVLGTHGFTVLCCTLLGLLSKSSEPTKTPWGALWLGGCLVSLTHLGYAGAVIFPLILVCLSMGVGSVIQALKRTSRLALTLLSLSMLIGGLWLGQLVHLFNLGVINNARPTSARHLLDELLTFGLSASVREFETAGFFQVVRHLPYNRSLFLVWPALLAILWLLLQGKTKTEFSAADRALFRRLTIAIILIFLLASLGNFLSYPLRPSYDYLYRDSIVVLFFLMAGVASGTLTTKPLGRLEGRPRLFPQPPNGTTTVIALLFILTGVSVGQVLPILVIERSQHGNLGCSEVSRLETIWVGEDFWNGTQPRNPFRPADCSLYQLILAEQYSVGAWLKIRQTSSDGASGIEIENFVEDANLEHLPKGSIDDVWLEVDGKLEKFELETNPEDRNLIYFAKVERCVKAECVFKVSGLDADRKASILWNYDPGLYSVPKAALTRSADGYIELSGHREGDLEIRYAPRVEQKISVVSAWTLFTLVPLARLLRNRLLCSSAS